MRNQLKTVLTVLLAAATTVVFTESYGQKADGGPMPRVFLLDAKQVQLTRQRIRDGDKNLTAAWARLEREARKALAEGPFSIVNKAVTPPSGDKHDYMTQAPYFWPDPKSPNGLPYLRRDGERNPEINKITDHRSLDQLESSVETLALAYYFKGDEPYAAKAVRLLRAFFLDPATRMNPNLEYAQFIPGVNTGKKDLAVRVLQEACQKRIATQIEPDGRQPLELARTKAWSYSNGNLDGLMLLATLGERVGVDLWNYQTSDGRSIRKALDFLTPVALSERKWQYQELSGVKPESLFPLMRRAANAYRDKQYQALMAKVPDVDPADRGRLLRRETGVTAARTSH